jgi:putative RecB family exonuclease
MATYSHSRLSSFEQCPLKYKFRYIEKLKPDIENTIEGFLGTKVHDTLEWVYNEILKGRTQEFNLDDLIEHYAISWNKDYSEEIKIVKPEFKAEDYFNKGIRFIIDYFTTHKPFKDNTIETEKRIFLTLADGNKIIGYIDRLTHNKETNILEIHDYKTANSMKSQQELDKDRQLALYSLAIKQIFPEAKDIHLIWHFLNFNKKVISKRTHEQLEQLKQDIMKLIKKIESTTEFPPYQSALCGWCEFQSYCPLMQNQQVNKNQEFQKTL